jgi:hypothetical protein
MASTTLRANALLSGTDATKGGPPRIQVDCGFLVTAASP